MSRWRHVAIVSKDVIYVDGMEQEDGATRHLWFDPSGEAVKPSDCLLAKESEGEES